MLQMSEIINILNIKVFIETDVTKNSLEKYTQFTGKNMLLTFIK